LKVATEIKFGNLLGFVQRKHQSISLCCVADLPSLKRDLLQRLTMEVRRR